MEGDGISSSSLPTADAHAEGDTKVETDLGVVQGKGDSVDVNVPQDEKDINAAFDDAWAVLRSKPPKPDNRPDEETRVKDSYAKCAAVLGAQLIAAASAPMSSRSGRSATAPSSPRSSRPARRRTLRQPALAQKCVD